MWRMRKTSRNRLSKGTDNSVVVEGTRGGRGGVLHMCMYMNQSFWLHILHCVDCVCVCVRACMQVWFKPGNLHEHMHAFCSGSLSTNYWRNLYARRFPAAITNSMTANAQNFLSWLASSPPLATALVIPLYTYGTLFLLSVHHCQGEGNLDSMGEIKSHGNNKHLSLFLPLSQCISVYISYARQWYTRVGSKSQRKCIVSICMCGYESSTKKYIV